MGALVMAGALISAKGLLPHGDAIQLIKDILWFESEPIHGEVSAEISAKGPYMGAWGFEDHWLIEFMAQASAAIYLLARRRSGQIPPRGYLVSVRDFVVYQPDLLKALDSLVISSTFEVEATPLGQSRCAVRLDKILVAEGELTFLLETEI
jgi:predicted hotdog family 3-hydroxylacyl-ACP dehydratase